MSIDQLEGFAREPGTNDNYNSGSNYWEACIIHITAGACGGDRSILLRGYANAYVPLEEDCGPGATQFAGMGMITWSCCEWNVRVTAIEFEKRDVGVRLSQYALDKGRQAIQQLIAAGIAPTYRNTPDDRIPVGGPISGFVSHASLHEIQCDEHNDWVFDDEMAYMMALASPIVVQPLPPPPPPDPNEGDDDMGLKLIKWKDTNGEHQDLIGIAADGSVFTTSGFEGKNYYISGPRAVNDPVRPRATSPVKVDQVPVVVQNDGEVRFRVQVDGPDGPGTGTRECYWRAADDPGTDNSKWGSYDVIGR